MKLAKEKYEQEYEKAAAEYGQGFGSPRDAFDTGFQLGMEHEHLAKRRSR